MRVAKLYPNDARKNESELPRNRGAINDVGMPSNGSSCPNIRTVTDIRIKPSIAKLVNRPLSTFMSRIRRAQKIAVLLLNEFMIIYSFCSWTRSINISSRWSLCRCSLSACTESMSTTFPLCKKHTLSESCSASSR